MRSIRFVLASLAVSALCLSTAFAAGDVYKWTDEKGLTHYTDSPPEGQQYKKVNVAAAGVRSAEPVAAPVAPADAAAAAAAAAAPTAVSQCAAARKNLDTFGKSQMVNMDLDGDGTPEPLDEAQRAEQIRRNQGLVDIYCPK